MDPRHAQPQVSGWYPDSPTTKRWWSGAEWVGMPVPTETVANPANPANPTNPANPADPADPARAERADPEPERTTVAALPAASLPTAVAPAGDAASVRKEGRRARRRRGQADIYASLLAVSGVISFFVADRIALSPTAALNDVVPGYLAIVGILAIATIAAAFLDRRQVLKSGQPTAASGFWILLTPIAYLAARAFHAESGGWAPFVVYALTSAAISIYLTVVFTMTFSSELQLTL